MNQSSTSTTNYSSDDIVKILDACKRSSVSFLDLGGVKVTFGTQYFAPQPQAPSIFSNIASEFPRHEQEVIRTDEKKIRSEMTDDLILENPVEFERRLLNGELTEQEEFDDHGESNRIV